MSQRAHILEFRDRFWAALVESRRYQDHFAIISLFGRSVRRGVTDE
jgi:hypothetical protein